MQVHVPLTKSHDGRLLETGDKAKGFTRLKKVENADSRRIDYLPNRRAVDIEFQGLTYSVSEGRAHSECCIHINLFVL